MKQLTKMMTAISFMFVFLLMSGNALATLYYHKVEDGMNVVQTVSDTNWRQSQSLIRGGYELITYQDYLYYLDNPQASSPPSDPDPGSSTPNPTGTGSDDDDDGATPTPVPGGTGSGDDQGGSGSAPPSSGDQDDGSSTPDGSGSGDDQDDSGSSPSGTGSGSDPDDPGSTPAGTSDDQDDSDGDSSGSGSSDGEGDPSGGSDSGEQNGYLFQSPDGGTAWVPTDEIDHDQLKEILKLGFELIDSNVPRPDITEEGKVEEEEGPLPFESAYKKEQDKSAPSKNAQSIEAVFDPNKAKQEALKGKPEGVHVGGAPKAVQDVKAPKGGNK